MDDDCSLRELRKSMECRKNRLVEVPKSCRIDYIADGGRQREVIWLVLDEDAGLVFRLGTMDLVP